MTQEPCEAFSRREALGMLGAGILGMIASSPSVFAQSTDSGDRPPNIVFILADDLGWHQLGCYGSTFYETPNLDRFATEGMRFTDAYAAAPVCSPTRASLLTGKYPARLHLTDFIPGRQVFDKQLLPPDWTQALPLSEVTIPELLHKAGYVSGHFGKWHLNYDKEHAPGRPGDPESQGFEDVYTTHKPKLLTNKDADPKNDPHNVAKITDRAIRFMENNKDRPFFCYVTHNSIHAPEMEHPDLIAKYEKKPEADKEQNRPVVGAMLEMLDKGVGRVLQTIDDLGLRDNTIVVFYADNGMLGRPGGIHPPLRSAKGYLYEGGIRVPAIVRWPGQVEPGSVSSEMVITNDFFPTFAEIVGLEVNDPTVDGLSLVPVLKQTGSLDRDTLCFHYPHYSPQHTDPCGAIREGNYKLQIWYGHPDGPLGFPENAELYNLAEDLGETKNLAMEQPEKTLALYRKFNQWLDEVGAQRVRPNPDFGKAPKEGEG